MDIHSDSGRVGRLEVVNTGRRRRWSEEEKLRIVAESFSAPRQASSTARRHGISNALLFAWRKALREGQLGEVPDFVPAVVSCEDAEAGTPVERPIAASSDDALDRTGRGRMVIVLPGGRRVIVEKDVDAAALGRVLTVLTRR